MLVQRFVALVKVVSQIYKCRSEWTGFNVSFQHLVNCKKSIERRTPNAQTSTWMPPRSISRRTDRRTDGVTDSPETLVEAQSSLYSKTIVDSLKVTGAKGDLCPCSFMSTGAHAPVAPVESAPMFKCILCTLLCILLLIRYIHRTWVSKQTGKKYA